MEYDAIGNVRVGTDRLGRRVEIDYDKLNRPSQARYNDATVNYGYYAKGPSRTPGEPFEWDVQLGRNATEGMRSVSIDGKHVNVSIGGRVTH